MRFAATCCSCKAQWLVKPCMVHELSEASSQGVTKVFRRLCRFWFGSCAEPRATQQMSQSTPRPVTAHLGPTDPQELFKKALHGHDWLLIKKVLPALGKLRGAEPQGVTWVA